MKYLLDMSTFIWFVEGDQQLSSTARSHIEDDDSELFISIVSLWEIVIEQRLNKLDFSANVQQSVLSGYRFTPEREKQWTKNYYSADVKELNYFVKKSLMI